MRFFGAFDVVDRLVLGLAVVVAGALLWFLIAFRTSVSGAGVGHLWLFPPMFVLWGLVFVRYRHVQRSRQDPDGPRVVPISLRRLFGDPDAITWALWGLAAAAPFVAAFIVVRVALESLLWLAWVPTVAFTAAMVLAGAREYRRAVRAGRSLEP